jgi:hypothetical protein
MLEEVKWVERIFRALFQICNYINPMKVLIIRDRRKIAKMAYVS